MKDDLIIEGIQKKNYDPIIKDPKPFKAKDGSYHATMEEVEKANEEYYKMRKSKLCSFKDELSYINGVRVEPQTTTDWDTKETVNEESKGMKR